MYIMLNDLREFITSYPNQNYFYINILAIYDTDLLFYVMF